MSVRKDTVVRLAKNVLMDGIVGHRSISEFANVASVTAILPSVIRLDM